MSLVSGISFLIALGILISWFRGNTDLLSPGKVFAFVWAFAIGLTDFKFSGLQHQWSLEVWMHIIIGPLALIIGTTLIYTFNERIISSSGYVLILIEKYGQIICFVQNEKSMELIMSDCIGQYLFYSSFFFLHI